MPGGTVWAGATVGTTGDSALRGAVRRAFAFLKAHPILCLLLLAPQVEYLTGSTQLSAIVGSPLLSLILLAQNLGSYGAAVLLIREARIRWAKGWASVWALGAAYGILNEGIGAATLFNPATGGPGGLANYGHTLGVNWINLAILIPIVHPLFSIALPLLLFDLALPRQRGRSLLSSRGVAVTLLVLGVDATLTSNFVSFGLAHFMARPILLAACLAGIALLVAVGRRLPSDLLHVRGRSPSTTPLRLGVAAALLPWAIFLGGGALRLLDAPPIAIIVLILGLAGAFLVWVFRNIGWKDNALQKVGLGAGLVAGLIPMGIVSQLGMGPGLIPVIAGDLLALLFFRWLWRRHSAAASPPQPPGSVSASEPSVRSSA